MARAGRALLLVAALAAAPAARAAEPPVPWDGVNPFDCVLQQAGSDGKGPQPEADPYCIEFDKTRQNVTQLGLVEFLGKEPERVAAASPKCFYFQSDHWRGSVAQENAATKTYEWDGHYFFDKARGDGGVWVSNFNFGGQTGDPRELPGFPAEWKPFFGPGTGGFPVAQLDRARPPLRRTSEARVRAHVRRRRRQRLALHGAGRPRSPSAPRPGPHRRLRGRAAPGARPAAPGQARLPALVRGRRRPLPGRAAQRPQRRPRRRLGGARRSSALDLSGVPRKRRRTGIAGAEAAPPARRQSPDRRGQHASLRPTARLSCDPRRPPGPGPLRRRP